MQPGLAVQEPAHPVKHPVAELARASVAEAVTGAAGAGVDVVAGAVQVPVL